MARHVAFEAEADGKVLELAYDTDDVAEVSTRTGVVYEGGSGVVPEADREAVLTVKFKPGRRPLWAPKEGGQ